MKILFAVTFFYLSFFLCHDLVLASEVRVSKINGLIDWDSEDNYVEAKKAVEISRKIVEDRQKKQQSQDAIIVDKKKDKDVVNKQNGQEMNKQTNKQVVNESFFGKSQEAEINSNNTEINDKKKHNIRDSDVVINDYILNNKNDYINNYVNKQNQDSKNKKDNEDEIIDLSIVPNIPKIANNKQEIFFKNHENSDFKLHRMLQKIDKNINNSQSFALFTKEAAKIAYKKPKELTLEMPNIKESFSKNKKNENLFNNNINANVYNNKLHNIYAVAEKMAEKKEYTVKDRKNAETYNNFKKNSSNKENKDTQSKLRNSSEDDVKPTDDGLSEDFEDNSDDNLEKKQIYAKNIGAPYPLKRSGNHYMTQYNPQNISQVVYDKNNKHLIPATFKEHVIEDVIENLGSNNAVNLARALIDKFGNVDVTDKDGNTLLMHAVAHKDQSLISMLLSEGASPNAINKDGFAPIHLAASNGDNDSVYSLMISGGNPNLPDLNGNTPLMYASKMCNSDSVNIMILLGGDPELINSINGSTAYDFANENKNPNIYKILKSASKKIYGKKKSINLNE